MIAILAILKAGASYVPIEVDYPQERINYIFSDLPFDLLITSSQQCKEKTHTLPNYIIVDDLICSGETVKHIINTISEDCPNAKCLGVYCFLKDKKQYDDLLWKTCQVKPRQHHLSQLLRIRLKMPAF